MSSVAYLNLRRGVPERREAFTNGLSALGYKVKPVAGDVRPKSGDVFVTWNRIGKTDEVARRFEKLKCAVLVVENATWGNDFVGNRWYHIAKKYHNQKGAFPVGDNSRWDNLGFKLASWRSSGEEVVLLQRGIGPNKVRMPTNFLNIVYRDHPDARIRKHPGMRKATPLKDDLANAGKVITWGSGAAIKALYWGIPVQSYLPNWIGEQDNTDAGRLKMFRELAWAQWTLDEIESGVPFGRLFD
jgi:hypothetical protein